MRSSLMFLVMMTFASCSFDPTTNPGTRCDEEESCPTGSTCYRGFCVSQGRCENEGEVFACYDGTDGTEGVGLCRGGQQECRQGVLTSCLGQVLPAAEVCNGADDDCDGSTDELDDAECDTGALGECRAGLPICVGADEVCLPLVDPTPEQCNGEDDDCDGEVDEDSSESCYPDGELGCVASEDGDYDCVGVCEPGARSCVAGELGPCEGGMIPSMEDGCTTGGTAVDDDCDGEFDEDCRCSPGDTQECYGAPMDTIGVGPCSAGTQTCSDGSPHPSFGACDGQITPEMETCTNEGRDDDCDGDVDNVPGRGETCTIDGAVGVCHVGVMECSENDLRCVASLPEDEMCNGLDDDCDGDVDEGFDTMLDRENCGACGIVCGEGFDCCGGECVDLRLDERHCGFCGNSCGDGLTCCGGGCVDTTANPESCGGCGRSCGDEQSCCSGVCADTRSDVGNCGVCGTVCVPGEACCGGTCAAPSSSLCATCIEDCDSLGLTCCSGSCVDQDVDEYHCGRCGSACGADDVCCGGACVGSDETHCGQGCDACADGDFCCDGACVPNDAANCNGCGNACLGSQTCCPFPVSCVDLSSSPGNCGGCGEECEVGEECSDGHCCAVGRTWCGDDAGCVNTNTDSDHCGRCGHQCILLACFDGACL